MEQFKKQLDRMCHDKGFIAALDQSGGSTPKALKGYGISESEYHSEEEMFNLIHQMRERVMTDVCFTGDKILGVILFEKTLNNNIAGVPTSEFLSNKNIVPFLKIDHGLEVKKHGVELMKPIPDFIVRLQEAKKKGVFGTKMRSVIYAHDLKGIDQIVQQQFDYALTILNQGLIPIIEPEVDIHANDKEAIEKTLRESITIALNKLSSDQKVMLKLTLPSQNNFYQSLIEHPQVVRLVALSGGYDLEQATDLLSKNKGMIASFSRALLDDLRVNQSTTKFSTTLSKAIDRIYQASIT